MKGVFPLPPDWFQDRYIYLPTSGHLISIQTERPVGYPNAAGYLVFMLGKTQYTVHRVIWAIQTGKWPIEVDHINHDKQDNRWCNLREVTHSSNGKNLSLKKNNTSGITGVVWNKERKKWQAQIAPNGKMITLGRFENLEDAIDARKKAELKYGFHSNHGTKQEEI